MTNLLDVIQYEIDQIPMRSSNDRIKVILSPKSSNISNLSTIDPTIEPITLSPNDHNQCNHPMIQPI